jgi:hypothetical protein
MVVVPRSNTNLTIVDCSFVGVPVALGELVEVLYYIIWLPCAVEQGKFEFAIGALKAGGGPLTKARHVPADVLRPLMFVRHYSVLDIR